MQKILIDTDPGQDIDDLLALWFALLRPELDVRAITTVMAPALGRARLVRRLLRHLGRTDVPVAAGMDLPLRAFAPGELAKPADLAVVMNHACFAEPPHPDDEPPHGDAVQLIIDTIERHPGEVVLACIAPLTNIACALRRKADLAPKIKAIALMGGEVALSRAEHNIASDPIAADIVLTSGVPIAMGTWSVTRQCALDMDDCARLGRMDTALGAAMAQAIAAWHPAQSWKPGPVLYDLFPIVWAFDRGWYDTKPMAVRVETRGGATTGLTMPVEPGTTIDVTTGLRPGLREFFMSTVLGA